ncbi:MAG: AMP-binding protein [Pseudomonadota bacterium]
MDLPDLERFDTLPKLLVHNGTQHAAAVAMREKDLGIWHEFTWGDVLANVRTIALALTDLEVRRGDVVAIIGRNRPNWLWSEWAVHAVGGLSLGLYEDVLGDEAAYLLNYAESRVVVCEDEEQVDKLLELGDRIPHVAWIVYHDPRGMRKYADPRLIDWGAFLARGAVVDASDPARFDREVAAGKGGDAAILCTTSGTTSHPKLAVLEHGRFMRHCARYLERDPREPTDDYVCMLPLPWIMEQVYVAVMSLLSRIRVNFPESGETAMHDMREIGPTHILLAPRVWEQTAADVRARIMDANRANRWLFETGMRRGIDALEQGRRDWVADALTFRSLKDRLGFRNVKSAATGGAALGPDTFKFFLAMGVPLRQLYGQTELCGAYTLQDGSGIDFDSSGLPFTEVELRIDHADANGVGEIVTRHPNMFRGYFKVDETPDVDAEGWMHTGDAGYLDDAGRLVVIDRLRDIATTSGGDRFSPQYIENKLKFSPYVGECVVLGDGRAFLSAILCIRFQMVAKWAEQKRVGFTTYGNLAANAQTYDLIAGEVAKVNESLPPAQRLRRFLLLFKELDADDGELTRTRKVRRAVIDQRYAPLIDAIYAGTSAVRMDAEVTFEDGRKGTIDALMAIRDLAADAVEPA